MGRKKSTISKTYLLKYWELELTNVVLNLFKWEGLPKEINATAMEKSIMLGGYCIFFKDKSLDKYFALPGSLTGVDVYGYPTRAKPIPKNGSIVFNELSIEKECCLIYANKTRTTAINHITEYADKLSDIDLAIKMNTLAMKHPVMIKTSEQTKESFETLMHQYEDNYYLIIGDKSLALDSSVDTLKLDVSAQEILSLQLQKDTLKNEFYQLFGVAGTVEKRERIVSGEMNAQMEQIGINREIWLGERLRAIKQINERFGLDVSVDFNKLKIEEYEQKQNPEQEGGSPDGE